MRLLRGSWLIIKEIGRHVLRRPVVGVLVAARTSSGQWLLVQRSDTGQWAMPGGTLEWGETLRDTALRELAEEAGVHTATLGPLLGAYSAPHRDFRFHAVTLVVEAKIGEPTTAPLNPLEIKNVRLFADDDLPTELSHHTTDMLHNARKGSITWE